MKKILVLSSFLLLGMDTPPAPTTTPVQLAQTSIPQTQTPTSPSVVPQSAPQVRLLSPGAAPQQPLRLRPAPNSKQQVTQRLDVGANSLKLPTIVTKADFTVTKVESNGDIYSQFVYTDADVIEAEGSPTAVGNSIRQQLRKFIGVTGTIVSNDRGAVKSSQFNVPQQADESTRWVFETLANLFSQASSSFPEEAVGIGAKWQITTNLSIAGINVTQLATYELVNVQGNIATLKVNLQQQAQPQPIQLPLYQGDLESYSAKGDGEIQVKLDGTMPIQSTFSMQTDGKILPKKEGGTGNPIATRLSISTTLESQ